MKFPLGQVVITPGAREAIAADGCVDVQRWLTLHADGDFGDLGASDTKLQKALLPHEADEDRRERMWSKWHLRDGQPIWIITEQDRSSTCILLPEDY